jgi:hypothetical protein
MRGTYVFVAVSLLFGVPRLAHAQALTLVANQPGSFDDISLTGTPVFLTDDQESVINPSIGNAVFPAGTVVIANNGGLGFPSIPGQDDLAPLNAPIPSTSAFNGRQSLLAYWDDLKGDDFGGLPLRGGKNGNVLWKVTGTTLIVQWNNRIVVSPASALALTTTGTVKFQIKIFGGVVAGPGAVYAQMIYADVQQSVPNGGASATIGFQKAPAGINNVQWSFNTPGAVSNGMVLSVVDANSIPAVSDAGNVALVLLILLAGLFVFRRGKLAV